MEARQSFEQAQDGPRSNWTRAEVEALHSSPFNDLLFRAQSVHRHFFDPNQVQISTLLSIKTGACPEDCGYCPQSAHYAPGQNVEKLMPLETIVAAAQEARDRGATRFCMGAAWRSPRSKELEQVARIVEAIKALGLETCATLGMLTAEQAQRLKRAGLDYYNHNLDTSPEYYPRIITTRTYEDRLETLAHVRDAGLNVCCGGIIGMGEQPEDRVGLLFQLATLPRHPESVPINLLVQVDGTPLTGIDALDPIEFIRTVALTRILMPMSYVRLSAGREKMSDETQALCFLAGANSIFYGEKLLTTKNPGRDQDQRLFQRLGLRAEQRERTCGQIAVGE